MPQTVDEQLAEIRAEQEAQAARLAALEGRQRMQDAEVSRLRSQLAGVRGVR
ncbi:hypothetical protein [Mameliella alba]|uniref:Uncharacterized protein n=1 Tax=Mameliella alba TaxID=561184 RepID=A0A0B3SI69_9RHOB|nr:hypothetical protein [Mameliella alba]KHQ50284.1 hypothetical protein OA50_05132 [Mameliella alba]